MEITGKIQEKIADPAIKDCKPESMTIWVHSSSPDAGCLHPKRWSINVADFFSDIKGMEVIGQGQWNKDENISLHDLFHIMGDQMTTKNI